MEQLATSGRSQIKIESISGGKLYLRSFGENCKGIIVQVGDEPARELGDCNQSLSVFNVNSSCTSGYQTVKITSGANVATQRVFCSEIGGQVGGIVCSDSNCDTGENCTSCPADCPCTYQCCDGVCCSVNTYCSGGSCVACTNTCNGICQGSGCTSDPDCTLAECCGNSVCGTGETCSNCPADCGTCPVYCLKLENSVEWSLSAGGGTYDSSVYSLDVDSDGTIEILTAGDAFYNSQQNGQLSVWNTTGGTINRENVTWWYTNGATYVWGVYSLDVDGDGTIEILTAGQARAGLALENYGQLRVWNFTDGTLNLESTNQWYLGSGGETVASSVYSIDVDGDSTIEILTAGHARAFPPESYSGQLRVWNRTGGTINLENTTEWYSSGYARAPSVYSLDVDSDSTIEIITAGYWNDGTRYNGQLMVWNRTGGKLNLENSTTWYLLGNTYAISVYSLDVDGDGTIEILTAGDAYNGTRQNGQLRIWNVTGGTINLENSTEWFISSDTYASSVYSVDVDGDGTVEIITAGYGTDGTRDNAQLRIWNRTGGTLNLENSTEWYTTGHTKVRSVYARDVDGDGTIEILTAGYQYDGAKNRGQVRVWNYTVC